MFSDLSRFLDPRRAQRLIAEACVDSAWEVLTVMSAWTVKYWPERRLTVRYQVLAKRGAERSRSRVLFGKVYRGRRGEHSSAALRWLRERAPQELAIPEPLGYVPHRRFLLMSGLDGTSLADSRDTPEAPARFALAGRALARFHGIPAGEADGHPVHDAAAEAQVLHAAAARMAGSSLPAPLRSGHLAAVTTTIAALAQVPARGPMLLHRDLHPEQILLGAGQVGLVDLDELALGEPELDLGNLIAHLELADLQEHGTLQGAQALTGALLDAYRTNAAVDTTRLAAYRAAALLRLASLERLATEERSVLPWAALVDALLRRAEATAD